LYAWLDRSLAHSLTLLLAPAGFGKTTLVNQWLDRGADPAASICGHRSVDVAWVSLEASDNDPLRFWRYVTTACLRLLGPQQRASGQIALTLLSAALHPPFDSPPIEIALTHLLNALADLPREGLLVLDDYHAISEARIHETLAFFIDHLPAPLRVLLLSRAEPDLPLLRWRARGEVSELHAADLRFSPKETAAFLHQALPAPLSEAALARLDSALEGWPAGLRLLSLALSGGHASRATEGALLSLDERADFSHRSLLDYFATEILNTQPEPMQRFLLQTSVLSRLCATLCDAVTASEGGGAQLEEAARSGLFLEAMAGPGEWYRYHALFAEAMRREAGRRLGEAALRVRALRASHWYEQAGMLTESIEAALLAPDLERAAWLIEQVDVLSFYEPQTMRRWLERLPEEVLREHPMLCHLLAVELRFPVELRIPAKPVLELAPPSETERERIRALLRMAEEAWRRSGTLAWVGANRAFYALSSSLDQDPSPIAVNYAQQALTLLPQGERLDRRLKMYRGSCLFFVGIEKLYQGQVGEAQQLLLRAQEDNAAPGHRYLAVDIRLALGKCHLLQGELRLASSHLREVLSYAPELGADEVTADALLELAWIAYERNELAGAEQQAREAQELAQRLSGRAFSGRAALQLALLRYAQGDSGAALEQVTALLAGAQEPWDYDTFCLLSRLRYWQGRLRVATGDLQGAQESLDNQPQSRATASIAEHLAAEILRGRLWLAQGKTEAAREQFAGLLPLAQEALHQYSALELELLLALTHAACDQEQRAHYWLRQALVSAAHEDYIRLFLSEGKPMLQLLRSLLRGLPYDTPLRSYALRIVRAASYPAGPRRAIAEKDSLLFEPLTAQEQRVLRLLIAGLSNGDIARELMVSVNTVKYHAKHLYQKLGVSNRVQAASAARALSLGAGD
jgi:LuxR family maltose regulon positive regulatory protein